MDKVWTWDYLEQIQLAVRAGLELWASELQVQCSYHPATLPPSLVILWTVARSKMVMFGSGTKCPSKSDVHFIESQIKGVNKGREQL